MMTGNWKRQSKLPRSGSCLLGERYEMCKCRGSRFGPLMIAPIPLYMCAVISITQALCTGRSLFLNAPPGWGKSCVSQAAALVLGGVTLVIQPLKALMEDQVR